MNLTADVATHEARLARLKETGVNGNGAGTPLAVAVRSEKWYARTEEGRRAAIESAAEPREGETSNEYWLRQPLPEESGVRWPTPRATEDNDYTRDGRTGTPRLTLSGKVKRWPTPCSATNRKSTRALTSSEDNGRRSGGGQSSPPGLEQAVEMSLGITPKEMEGLAPEELPAATRAFWPTPNAQGGTGYMSGSNRDTWRPTLEGAARMAPEGDPPVIVAAEQRAARETWPTPKSSPSGPDFARINRPESGGDDLATAVARESLPTPSARDWKGTSPAEGPRKTPHLNEVARATSPPSGSLSPAWVERLMNWPDGWSAPGPLAPGALDRWLATDWRVACGDGSWEAGVPRVAVGVKHRVARLKALGNGWVPVQAALAIRRLVATLEALPRSGGADFLEGPS